MAGGAITELLLLRPSAASRGPVDNAFTAAAQVGFDAATNGAGLTFSHTCSGTNRYLTVGVSIAGSAVSVTGITYNGVAMTLIKRSVSGNGAELWGLINPASGAHNVVITLSGGAGTAQGAISFTNANQVLQNGLSDAAGGNATSPVTNAIAAPPGSLLVNAYGAGGASTTTDTAGWNDGGGDAQSYAVATGGPQTMGYSGAPANWAIATGTVLPVATVTDSVGGQHVLPRTVTDQGVSVAGGTSYLTDTFTRTVGSGGWGTADTGTGWATPATNPSAFSVNGSQGLLATSAATYRIFAGQSVGAVELRHTISFPVAAGTSASLQSLASIRVQDNNNYVRAQVLLAVNGGLSLQLQQVLASTATGLGGGTINVWGAGGYTAGEVWHLKIRMLAGANGQIDAAIWKDGTTEPAYVNGGGSSSTGNYGTVTTNAGTQLSGAAATWTTGDFGITFTAGAGNPATTITYDDFNVTDGVTGVSDTVGTQRGSLRTISDTGVSQSDSVATVRARKVTDTGATVTDSVTRLLPRPVTDTGITPELLDVDTFGRTTSNGWGVGEAGTPAPTYVLLQGSGQASEFATDGTYGTIATVGSGVGTSRTVGVGLSVARGYVLTKVRMSSASPGANYDSAAFIQWVDANNHVRIRLRVSSAGALTSTLEEIVAGTANPIYVNSHGTYTANTDYWLQMWNDGTQIVARVWKDGTTPQPLPAPNNFLAVTDAASMAVNYASIGTLATQSGDAGVRHLLNAGVSGTMTTKFDSLEIHQLRDSVGAVFAPGSVNTNRNITDTGATITDSIQRAVVRLVTDTGTTTTDAVGRAVVRLVSDTGVTNTDSVGPRAIVRQVADTGVTQSDSIGRAVFRKVSDTGTTITDSVAAARNFLRSVSDTGATITDSIKRAIVRLVADTGVTITDSVATQRGFLRTVTDTGTTTTDSIGPRAITRAITDTGLTQTDSVGRVASHPRAVTDTGTTITDSVATQLGRLRPISDTGTTITDSVATLRNRAITDTGATISDSVAKVAAHPRAVTDTGATITDSVATQLGRLRPVSDTGATISDSVVRQVAFTRPVSDTGATISDAVGRAVVRLVSDTGVTLTDSVVRADAATRPVSDTGTTISDSVVAVRNRVRAISDTGATITDSVVRALAATRPITDTGATITDSVAAARNRPKSVTDTGATITDSVRTERVRQITDTGSTITDAIRRAINRLVTDTGVTQTDTVTTGGVTLRPITDTGTTITDSVRLATVRQVSDTGATITDSVAKVAAHPRAITDTGTTITDSVVRTPNRVRSVTDTGTTITDSIRRAIVRQVADQGATITDSLQLATNRRVSDTGATITDSVTGGKAYSRTVTSTGTTITDSVHAYASRRNVTDQGATITDTVAIRQGLFRTVTDTGLTQSDSVVTGGAGARSVTDTGVSQSDSVRRLVGRTTITDTGTVITDTVDRYVAVLRTISDTGATVLDTVNSSSTRLRPVSDTGTTITDSVTRQRVVPRTITDTGSSITDNVTRPFVVHRILDDGTTITDDVVARRVRPNPVVNVEMTLRAAGGSIEITTTVEPISSTSTTAGTLILTTRRAGDGQLGTRGVGNMTLEDR